MNKYDIHLTKMKNKCDIQMHNMILCCILFFGDLLVWTEIQVSFLRCLAPVLSYIIILYDGSKWFLNVKSLHARLIALLVLHLRLLGSGMENSALLTKQMCWRYFCTDRTFGFFALLCILRCSLAKF